MRNLVTTIALLALISFPAIAQTGGGAASSNSASQSQSMRDAPVGHRQPRVGDLSAQKAISDPNDPLSKENALLDKKIKSICRGC